MDGVSIEMITLHMNDIGRKGSEMRSQGGVQTGVEDILFQPACERSVSGVRKNSNAFPRSIALEREEIHLMTELGQPACQFAAITVRSAEQPGEIMYHEDPHAHLCPRT
jgi:hypothetical protein